MRFGPQGENQKDPASAQVAIEMVWYSDADNEYRHVYEATTAYTSGYAPRLIAPMFFDRLSIGETVPGGIESNRSESVPTNFAARNFLDLAALYQTHGPQVPEWRGRCYESKIVAAIPQLGGVNFRPAPTLNAICSMRRVLTPLDIYRVMCIERRNPRSSAVAGPPPHPAEQPALRRQLHRAAPTQSEETDFPPPVAQGDAVQTIRHADQDATRPSLSRKALVEFEERGISAPGYRVRYAAPTAGRSSSSVATGRFSGTPSDAIRLPRPISNMVGATSFSIYTPRSNSSRISYMSDSASRVSRIPDVASKLYREMGGSIFSPSLQAPSVNTASWARRNGHRSATPRLEAMAKTRSGAPICYRNTIRPKWPLPAHAAMEQRLWPPLMYFL